MEDKGNNKEQDTRCLAVPLETAQAMVSYLETRPYKEVAMMLSAVQRCPIINITTNPPETAATEPNMHVCSHSGQEREE